MIAASMEVAISTKFARPRAPERASCPDFSPKAASSGMPRLLFQKQSRGNAGTM